MQGKYFTKEIKPIISSRAVGQHTVFADGDVLFDWTPFNIPKGGGRLIGAHVEIRPKGDAGATPNLFPLELLFARSSQDYVGPTTLGPLNAAAATAAVIGTQTDRFLGHVPILAADFGDTDALAVASTSDTNGIVLQNEEGFHARGNVYSNNITTSLASESRFYVGGIAGGNFDFISGVLINNGTLNGSVFTVDGVDPRLSIAVGDSIAATTTADTAVQKDLGTVLTVAANTITLTETTSNNIVNNDFIYNTKPIRILLTFER